MYWFRIFNGSWVVAMIGEFTGRVSRDEKSTWTCVVWPDSVETLGTGKPIKVVAVIGTLEFTVTLMPIGGKHMVPLRKAVLKALELQIKDQVTVRVLRAVSTCAFTT